MFFREGLSFFVERDIISYQRTKMQRSADGRFGEVGGYDGAILLTAVRNGQEQRFGLIAIEAQVAQPPE